MRVTRGRARGKSSTKAKQASNDLKEDEADVVAVTPTEEVAEAVVKTVRTRSAAGTRATSQKRPKAVEEDTPIEEPEAEQEADAQIEGDSHRDAIVKRLVGVFEECTKETSEASVSPRRSSSRRKDTTGNKSGLHRVLASQMDANAPMTPGRRALGASKGRVKAMSTIIEKAMNVSDAATANRFNAVPAINKPAVDSPSLSHAVRAKRVSGASSLLVKKLTALAPESKVTRVKDAVCALEGHFQIDSTEKSTLSELVQKEVEQVASPKAKSSPAKKRVQPHIAAAIAAVQGQGPPLHDYEVFDDPEPKLRQTAVVDTPVAAAVKELTAAKSSKVSSTKRRTNASAAAAAEPVSWDLVDSPAVASTSSITPSFDTPSREGPAVKITTRARRNSSTSAPSGALGLEPSLTSPKKAISAIPAATKDYGIENTEESNEEDDEPINENLDETAAIPPATPQSSCDTSFCLPMDSPVELPPPTSTAKLPVNFNFNFVNANPATRSLIPPAQSAPSAPSFASPLRKSFVPVNVDDDGNSVISSAASTPASVGPPQVPKLFSNNTNIQNSPSKRVASQGNPLLVPATPNNAAENHFSMTQEHQKEAHDSPEPLAQSPPHHQQESQSRPGRTHVARLTLEPATAATPNTKKMAVSVPVAADTVPAASTASTFDVAKIGREFTVDMMVPANPNIRFTTAAQTPPAAERVTGKRSRGGVSVAGRAADNVFEDSPARLMASPAGGKGGRRFAAGARKRVRVAVEEDDVEAGEWSDVETVAEFADSSKMSEREVLVPKTRGDNAAEKGLGGAESSKNYVEVGDDEDDSEEDEEDDVENLGVEAQPEERVAGEWIFDLVKGIGRSIGLVSSRV
ncbi:hypothetical protein HDU81_010588 [Chytriomyces hyalinus]|nr:hypothetical protein HDU81_010588 [Chytriomyces hyalinus]